MSWKRQRTTDENPDRPHRIKATIGGITVNGQLHAKDGSYSPTIPKHLNRPGTSEELQRLGRADTISILSKIPTNPILNPHR
jgi:hypothetical protein